MGTTAPTTSADKHAVVGRAAPPPALHPSAPGALVLNIPHVVEAILASAPRSTLVACLRVKQLHPAAGKRLYRAVRVDEGTMASFFLGAQLPSNLATFLWPGYAVPTRPTATDFKTPLLAHVRVLSLGTHSPLPGVCSPGPAGLLPNLHTLRIVRSPDASGRLLAPLCGASTYCHLVGKLAPHKLVVRNLDDREDYLPSRWPARAPHEIVWFYPCDGPRYRPRWTADDGELALLPIAKAKHIFYPGWEVSSGKSSLMPLDTTAASPVFIDASIEVANSLADSLIVLTSVGPSAEGEAINVDHRDSFPRWRRFMPAAAGRSERQMYRLLGSLGDDTTDWLTNSMITPSMYLQLDDAERAYELDDGTLEWE